MPEKSQLTRPQTLQEGAEYWFLDWLSREGRRALTRVRFCSYHPCPALVVVAHGNGKRVLCPRDDLFIEARAE